MIKTVNLRLLPVALSHIELLHQRRTGLAPVLGVRAIPDEWPQFPHAFALPTADRPLPPPAWGNYFIIAQHANILIGNGGFKGAPDVGGMVEIGYEIAPAHRDLGHATEAARGLIDFAFGHGAVKAVTAHTLGQKSASTRVLEKTGMVLIDTLPSEQFGAIWRWQIQRGERGETRLPERRAPQPVSNSD